MSEDLFASVPEFLAAFNNILNSGFFEEIRFSTGGTMGEGKIYNCSITMSGCVPSCEQYAVDGCGVIIDPNTVIAACRKLADENQVEDITTEVKTENWPLWDTDEENIVGSKGNRIKLFLCIRFKT